MTRGAFLIFLAALCATLTIAGCAASTSTGSPSPTSVASGQSSGNCSFLTTDAYVSYTNVTGCDQAESILAYQTGAVWASASSMPSDAQSVIQACHLTDQGGLLIVYSYQNYANSGNPSADSRDVCTYYETTGWAQ